MNGGREEGSMGGIRGGESRSMGPKGGDEERSVSHQAKPPPRMGGDLYGICINYFPQGWGFCKLSSILTCHLSKMAIGGKSCHTPNPHP